MPRSRRKWSEPPALPADLAERFGEPEEVFGPNLRFRVRSAALGLVLLLIALTFVVVGLAAGPAERGIYLLLSAALAAVGTAAVALPQRVPPGWVFVCPRGLVRARGADWSALPWPEATRFVDARLSTGPVTAGQCRIVLAAGGEWGFLSSDVADYPRLAAVLRQRVADRGAPA